MKEKRENDVVTTDRGEWKKKTTTPSKIKYSFGNHLMIYVRPEWCRGYASLLLTTTGFIAFMPWKNLKPENLGLRTFSDTTATPTGIGSNGPVRQLTSSREEKWDKGRKMTIGFYSQKTWNTINTITPFQYTVYISYRTVNYEPVSIEQPLDVPPVPLGVGRRRQAARGDGTPGCPILSLMC